MQLTDTQKLEFITHGFELCPVCSNEKIEVDIKEIGNNALTFGVECDHCYAESEKIFILENVEIIQGGKLEIKELNALQLSRYLENGQACPVCQHNNADLSSSLNCDEFQPAGNIVKMKMDCPCCKTVWEDSYKLSDVKIISSGKYAEMLEEDKEQGNL